MVCMKETETEWAHISSIPKLSHSAGFRRVPYWVTADHWSGTQTGHHYRWGCPLLDRRGSDFKLITHKAVGLPKSGELLAFLGFNTFSLHSPQHRMAPACMKCEAVVAVPLSSRGSACTPVAAPVTMSPSERKNSAARAVSSMLTSEVRAWELRKHTYSIYIYIQAWTD